MTEETRRELHAWEKCMRLTTAKVAPRSVRLSYCVSLFCLVCRKIVRASDGRRCCAFSRLCMHAMSNIVVGIAVFPLSVRVRRWWYVISSPPSPFNRARSFPCPLSLPKPNLLPPSWTNTLPQAVTQAPNLKLTPSGGSNIARKNGEYVLQSFSRIS